MEERIIKLSQIGEELLRIEEKLRKIATELQEARVSRDTYMRTTYIRTVASLNTSINILIELYDKCVREVEISELKPYCTLIKDVYESINRLLSDLNEKCRREGNYVTYMNISTLPYRELTNNVKNIIGRSCGNLIIYEESLQPPAIIDGLANCVHVIAEEFLKLGSVEQYGKCIIAKGSSEKARELCLRWNKYVEEFRRKGYYMTEDYDKLFGYTIDDKVYFRVGSAIGHAAVIDLREGSFKYYDDDLNVIKIVKRYVEDRLAGSCMFNRERNELSCHISNIGEKLNDVAYILASVTSMDIRLINDEVDEKYMIPMTVGSRIGNYDRDIIEVRSLEETCNMYSRLVSIGEE